MATAVDQCKAGFNALKDYFKALKDYYLSGSTPAVQTGLVEALDFEEILSFAVNSVRDNTDFSVGAAVETVQHFAALKRELEMASERKSSIYLSASTEHGTEEVFYGQNASFMSSVINGASTSGSQA